MKGYKLTYNGKTRNLTYKPGRAFVLDGKLIMCLQGFHFCQDIKNLLEWMDFNKNIRIFEIEAEGNIIEDYDKSVTDKMTVIRELTDEELEKKLGITKTYDNGITITKEEPSSCAKYDENGYLIEVQGEFGKIRYVYDSSYRVVTAVSQHINDDRVTVKSNVYDGDKLVKTVYTDSSSIGFNTGEKVWKYDGDEYTCYVNGKYREKYVQTGTNCFKLSVFGPIPYDVIYQFDEEGRLIYKEFEEEKEYWGYAGGELVYHSKYESVSPVSNDVSNDVCNYEMKVRNGRKYEYSYDQGYSEFDEEGNEVKRYTDIEKCFDVNINKNISGLESEPGKDRKVHLEVWNVIVCNHPDWPSDDFLTTDNINEVTCENCMKTGVYKRRTDFDNQ